MPAPLPQDLIRQESNRQRPGQRGPRHQGPDFERDDIGLAMRMKDAGLDWTPAAGQYVHDPEGVVDRPSPFGERIFFILNYEYFMTLLGGVESFHRRMVWLPTLDQMLPLLPAGALLTLSPQRPRTDAYRLWLSGRGGAAANDADA